jgi:uncharacterized SAM-binding protein YcdF (DUF218 family)
LLLPPLLLVLLAGLAGWAAWRRWRPGGLLAMLAMLGLLLLATPMVAGLLLDSLEREVVPAPRASTGASTGASVDAAMGAFTGAPMDAPMGPPVAAPVAAPGGAPGGAPRVAPLGASGGAIIILGGDWVHTGSGPDIGAFTLERLRAGAALARRTGLPVLVTGGGPPDEPPLAVLMAASLAADFGIAARWIEPRAADTHENAVFSVALLREAGIGSAHVVSHAWHLPRALEAFARLGFAATPAPVRLDAAPDGRLSAWLPRPDYWGRSWYALREWAGRLAYALRDG